MGRFSDLPKDTHEGCPGASLLSQACVTWLPWGRAGVCLAEMGAGFPEEVTSGWVWKDTRLGCKGVAVTQPRQKPEGVTR